MYVQVNIKIDQKSYPKEAEKLLYLRNKREINKLFRIFLQERIKQEEQLDLFKQ